MNISNSTTVVSTTPVLPVSGSLAVSDSLMGYPDIPAMEDFSLREDSTREDSTANRSPAPAAQPFISESPILQKSILISISFSQIGRTRQVREGAVELAREHEGALQVADTDKSLVRVNKTLFTSKELKAIERLDDEARAFIARKCLPSPVRKSVYLVPLANVQEVDAKLREFRCQRVELVKAFQAAYPELLQNAAQRLRELFDLHDYPSAERVGESFSFTWQFMALGVPDALAEINAEMWERERDKVAAQWAETETQIENLLRVRLKGMVECLVERLKPTAEGKSKVFRNTLVTNITTFMDDFHALNITNNEQLAEVVAQAGELLAGVDPQELRDSHNIRKTVLEGAERLEAQLSTMIVDKPKRRISLDD